MMKVLHVINYLSDGGGAEKLMEDLLPEIKSKGVDVSIVVLRDIDTNNSRLLRENGIKIITIGRGDKLYSISKMLQLIPIMRKFDVVHAHLTAPFLMCAFNSYFCKAKLVHTVHNTDTHMRHVFGLKNIEKWALGRYNTIVACSNEAEETLRTFVKSKKMDILTISNGVKLDKIYKAEPSGFEKGKDEKSILMVAVFRPQKNHETLIKATKLLPKNFNTYFVGYGGRMEEMKSLAKELGLENRVHFLGKRTDVPHLLKLSDFIVLSSHYEGLSIASIEGMAAGKPFIASDVPGLKEMVGGYGKLFTDGDEQQLAEIIRELADDKKEYKRISAQCKERALSFDISKTAEGYICVYKKIMQGEEK